MGRLAETSAVPGDDYNMHLNVIGDWTWGMM